MKNRVYISVLIICSIVIVFLILINPTSTRLKVTQETVVPTNETGHTRNLSPQVTVQSNVALSRRSADVPSIQEQIEEAKRETTNRALVARTPLLYYGKVIDESNCPIAGVLVSYGGNALDETLTKEIRNEGTVTTDERGIFKIDGLYGLGLMFELSHPNYYPYPNNSTGFDVRSRPRDGIVEDSEAHARIFRMHSKGHPVPLVHRADGVNVPLDNTPTTLDLRGSDYNQIIGQLVVEASGDPPQRYNQQPFDWDVKVTVPNGGLVEYTNYFDFIAPDSGYQPSIEFVFPKETSGWTDTVSRNYFVKLPSGYARINVYIGAKRHLFFSVEYDYNPDGSANLERVK